MDRLEGMQTFVAVVEAGSFSAAAERLGVAKSAISRRLAELEGHLGAQLLRRTTRRFSLTEAGQLYLERCQRILADVEEAEIAVASGQAALRGRLRIAAPFTFGIEHLSPLLPDFMQTHPELQLDLNLNDRQINLIEEGFDLALRIGHLSDSSLVARRLATIRMVICASPDYIKRSGEPSCPQELEQHQGLVYSNMPESSYWSFSDRQGGQESVKVPVRMRANNGDVLLDAAAAGEGITIQPTFIAWRHLVEGRLTPILRDYPITASHLYAVYPTRRHLPLRVRHLIEYLEPIYGETPPWDQRLIEADEQFRYLIKHS